MSEWFSVLGAGLGGLGMVLLLVRLVTRERVAPAAETDPGLPWMLRSGWRLSAGLLPLMRHVPSRLRRGAARDMAAERWATSVPGDRWLAIRCAHALVVGLLALCGAQMAGGQALPAAAIATLGTFVATGHWIRHRRSRREQEISRELPPYLDLLTVSIEAGSSLTAALRLIVGAAPPGALRDYFERVLREIRAGRLRAEAFASVAEDLDSSPLRTLATALSHGEASGMSLGAVLRSQGAQRTAERFARAEKLAMEAPVKLLGPLILCIFPCTFIVLAVPIVVRLKEALGS